MSYLNALPIIFDETEKYYCKEFQTSASLLAMQSIFFSLLDFTGRFCG